MPVTVAMPWIYGQCLVGGFSKLGDFGGGGFGVSWHNLLLFARQLMTCEFSGIGFGGKILLDHLVGVQTQPKRVGHDGEIPGMWEGITTLSTFLCTCGSACMYGAIIWVCLRRYRKWVKFCFGESFLEPFLEGVSCKGSKGVPMLVGEQVGVLWRVVDCEMVVQGRFGVHIVLLFHPVDVLAVNGTLGVGESECLTCMLGSKEVRFRMVHSPVRAQPQNRHKRQAHTAALSGVERSRVVLMALRLDIVELAYREARVDMKEERRVTVVVWGCLCCRSCGGIGGVGGCGGHLCFWSCDVSI
ncbi:hypothetical protein PM082_021297 [Marasmius tenuissimus]|nr:hypothetical protein PM082_021297 [Marasmius tenuissimus]